MKKLISLFFLVFLVSCGVFKNKSEENSLNYMRNIDSIATNAALNSTVSTIQPGDQLVIVVSAKDLDVVKPFNQNFSSSQMVQDAVSGGNLRPNPISITGPTYLVDTDGVIDFPILGEIKTTGKTIEAFKDDLRETLKEYIKDPVVSVTNSNYKVTVLGEVNRPGQYLVTDGHATILNALGLAGDLTTYGKRDDVLLVRNINGNITKHRVNLNNAEFINSPYYQLKQGDVIYVSANDTKEKISKLNPNNGLYISIASILITIVALIVRK
ncbi:polysaccharide biosynthesis/export family protein [Halpernia sp.]|uniref:polysaccharide biosynthesis/export family protein n=1 Tax=Halpernia sp. TaxID=2782209 RepID=UPI003A8F3089